MNKIFVIGNLVRDPESGSTPRGISYCTFTIAVDRKYKVEGEKVTDYFKIKAWRMLADLCARSLTKGKKVSVFGELQVSTYEGKDGQTRVNLDVNAEDIEFLSPREGSTAPKEKPTTYEDGFTDLSSDDIPF